MKGGTVKFLDVVVSLLVLALGGLLVYSSMLDESLNTRVHDVVANKPLVGAAVGLLIIFSVVLRVAASRKPREKDRFINFEADGGSVGVSTKAIRDFIEEVCREFSAVQDLETRLIQDRDALDVAINVKVVSGNRIPELSRMLQQRVRERVRESLGLEDIRNITIKVQEIVGAPALPDDAEPSE